MSEGERRGNYWGTESISDDLKSQRGVNYMMYNPQLDTFICVVEAGSFSKAAEELYISAPAVIKQINSLENRDRKSTRLNSSHSDRSRMPSSA